MKYLLASGMKIDNSSYLKFDLKKELRNRVFEGTTVLVPSNYYEAILNGATVWYASVSIEHN